jgi:hypothetical protein
MGMTRPREASRARLIDPPRDREMGLFQAQWTWAVVLLILWVLVQLVIWWLMPSVSVPQRSAWLLSWTCKFSICRGFS